MQFILLRYFYLYLFVIYMFLINALYLIFMIHVHRVIAYLMLMYGLDLLVSLKEVDILQVL